MQLEEVVLDGNRLTVVELDEPPVSLSRLTLSSNSLTNLPRWFHAPELVLLDVTNNSISAITNLSFTCCRNLRQLRAAANRITNISDDSFRGSSLMTELDLSE